ncbi:glycosyl hydrolase family 43 protein [Aspergillus karnatakaensis]|uniref:putative xylosidase/glycosyl hydrolase n=1 Tax=Aspergillus karnatakaensis TaxID=1810916 RepID=UPI003CCCCD7A
MLPFLLATALTLPLTLAQSQPDLQTFTNPIIYADYPDNDIFHHPPSNSYYFSSSSFHYSPGAPILQSWDLINWHVIGHSLPSLAFGPAYDINGNETSYNLGTWASTLRYRPSNEQWYWIGCTNFWTTWVYTAPEAAGPWEQRASFQPCFYDCGMLVDDDDSLYVVYGSNNVSVSQLAADGLSIQQTHSVFTFPEECTSVEGNRMYKINGTYYVLNDCPSDSVTLIWKSESDSPFGPYTYKPLHTGVASPVPGTGPPVQGSLVEGRPGEWYFMSFAWNYPLGRVPVLAPIAWGEDGFPVLETVDGGWGESYPLPLPEHPLPEWNWTGVDYFEGTGLGVLWQWNHNPDLTRVGFNEPGLRLYTASVTGDLYLARNTLTRRLHGEDPYGIVEIEFGGMVDGDVAGLAAFKDASAWIGVLREGSEFRIAVRYGLMMGQYGGTTSVGEIVATAPIAQTKVWFKVSLGAAAVGSHEAVFEYSLDGETFVGLGEPYKLTTDYLFFMGYRYGIFNFATKELGGFVDVVSFVSESS